MEEFLPTVRIPSELRRKLDLIVEGSITQNLSSHIRYAVERYVHENWTPELQVEFEKPQEANDKVSV